jgi:uncharacterized protein (TIGR00255 family)
MGHSHPNGLRHKKRALRPMPVYSMTGYATALSGDGTQDGGQGARPGLVIEMRSVNSRFLDLSFKLAEELRSAEPALRELLTARLRRGKVEVRAWFEGRGDAVARAPTPHELQRLAALQDGILAWCPGAAPLSVADILQITARQAVPPGQWHDTLLALAAGTLDALVEARAREGARLVQALTERLRGLRELAAHAQPLVPALVEQQRQRFLERWQEALGAAGAASDAAQDRALAEAAAYAMRIDVAEELTRLGAHLDEIERLLRKGGEVGKRLDFLIQELHREANTLGAKSSSLELTRISVDMKVLIEQMREQVQNLE